MSPWISVDNRLPKLGVPVLIHIHHKIIKDTNLTIAFLDERDGYQNPLWIFDWGKDIIGFYAEVTHWMPLPKKPVVRKPKQKRSKPKQIELDYYSLEDGWT